MKGMTISELINILDKYNKDTKVRLAVNDGYNFFANIEGVKVEGGIVLIYDDDYY